MTKNDFESWLKQVVRIDERYSHLTDTLYVCSVHGETFDAEIQPCNECWNEYERQE